MAFRDLKKLTPRDQALIAVAVLLDGREAENYLKPDQMFGQSFSSAAKELAQHQPEVRMPLTGTVLRQAIEEMSRVE